MKIDYRQAQGSETLPDGTIRQRHDYLHASVYFDRRHGERVRQFAVQVEDNPDPPYVATMISVAPTSYVLQLLGTCEHVGQVIAQLGWLDE